MRPSNLSSDIQVESFGFIDYFVDGTRQRLPVQFVRIGPVTWARLGYLQLSPSYIRVTPAMKAEASGDMQSVCRRYAPELAAVLRDGQSWIKCLSSGASSLTLFRVLHSLRMHGQTVSQAVVSAEDLDTKIDRSEHAAMNGIAQYLTTQANNARMGAVPQLLAAGEAR